MHWIFEPGLFSNGAVRTALLLGAVVAIVSATVGVFTVLRGQSFAGHALADVATAGGAGATLVALSPLAGFVAGGVLGAEAMDLMGVQRVKGRDIATGVVLGAATGLSALFLYLVTLHSSSSGTTQQILFGSIFNIDSSTLPTVMIAGSLVLIALGLIRRPLLLSSLSVELASARGVRLRLVSATFMGLLAVAVGLSSIAIGSILSTALLIGPPASSLKVSGRFSSALVLASVFGVLATWLGVVLAYDSFYWFPSKRGLPVSFFVVAIVVVEFVVTSLVGRHRAQRLKPESNFRTETPEQVGWI